MGNVAEHDLINNRYMDKDTNWTTIISKAVESCLELISDKEVILHQLYAKEPFEINPFECNVAFISIINCVYYSVIVNCPKKVWETCKCIGKKI